MQLIPYWWKLVLAGMWMVDKYVHDDPNGNSLALHMQEGMENWIGLLKQLFIQHVRANPGWMKRLIKYFDLYVIAGLRENICDYRVTLLKCVKHKNLVYDSIDTPNIEFLTDNLLPAQCKDYLDMLDKIEFNKDHTIDAHLTLVRLHEIPPQMKERMRIVSESLQANMHMFMIDADTPVADADVSVPELLEEWRDREAMTRTESLLFYTDVANVQYQPIFPQDSPSSDS